MLIVEISLILLHNVSMIIFIEFNEILCEFIHNRDIMVLNNCIEYTCLLFISLDVINIECLNGMGLTFIYIRLNDLMIILLFVCY
jgi:hypothetical protein